MCIRDRGKSQEEEEKAVKCGYWHLWRYNPALEEEGKNPFQLDSKEPNWEDFQGFLKGEVRYASVMKQYPAEAEELFKAAEENEMCIRDSNKAFWLPQGRL